MAVVSSHFSPDATPRDTFVVRIWSSDGGDLLRGHIQHVRTRKRAYFTSRERLTEFIQDHSRDPNPDPCQS
jgi:hypothetical protein